MIWQLGDFDGTPGGFLNAEWVCNLVWKTFSTYPGINFSLIGTAQ